MMKQETRKEKIRSSDFDTNSCMCVSPTPRNSVTLAGWPTMWLYADTIYMEIASDRTD